MAMRAVRRTARTRVCMGGTMSDIDLRKGPPDRRGGRDRRQGVAGQLAVWEGPERRVQLRDRRGASLDEDASTTSKDLATRRNGVPDRRNAAADGLSLWTGEERRLGPGNRRGLSPEEALIAQRLWEALADREGTLG